MAGDEPENKEQVIDDKEIKLTYRPITAHDLLIKSEEEIKEIKKKKEDSSGKRETHKTLKDLKILAAIMLGKKSNKELSKVLDTDKSFTSKQIKQLEKEGLVHKTGEGKKTKYEVNEFNVMKFLTSKVVFRWGTQEKQSFSGPQKTKKGFFREGKKAQSVQSETKVSAVPKESKDSAAPTNVGEEKKNE